MHPWIIKYKPKSLKEVVGQDKVLVTLQSFVKEFPKKRSALVYGPTGIGKTAAVHALANELDLELLEINASDTRNEDQIMAKLGASSKQMSLFGKGKILLVDEIDGLAGREDRGGVGAIAKVIQKSSFPIIMTANDPWNKKLKSLQKKSEMIEFVELGYADVYEVLKRIAKAENVEYDEFALKSLSRRVGGDLRAGINDLESLAPNGITRDVLEDLSDRRKIEKIESALLKIFKTTDPAIALSATEEIDENLDELLLWLDENIPMEYKKPEDLKNAYEALSKADIFRKRITRWQYWRFLVYVNQFLTAGVALAKQEKNRDMMQYKRATRLLKIWMANQRYLKRKRIAEKLADKTHCSTKRAIESLPFIIKMFNDDISEFLELDKEEKEWMLKSASS